MSEVQIQAGHAVLSGSLTIPETAIALVLFAHGSGSSRHSPRNQFVAHTINNAGLGTLLFDLLTQDEEATDTWTREHRFNIGLLAQRLVSATKWAKQQEETRDLRIGYFGSSTGGAAALVAAAELPQDISAVVSRGGRPDLAGDALPKVEAPTLLIVGGNDDIVIELNEMARDQMKCEVKLEIVPGASHLFEEPGALEKVAQLASDWFVHHIGGARPHYPVIPRGARNLSIRVVVTLTSLCDVVSGERSFAPLRMTRVYFCVPFKVTTRPRKLLVPQMPLRKHSNCTIWL